VKKKGRIRDDLECTRWSEGGGEVGVRRELKRKEKGKSVSSVPVLGSVKGGGGGFHGRGITRKVSISAVDVREGGPTTHSRLVGKRCIPG